MLKTYLSALSAFTLLDGVAARCRSQPGQPGFPTREDWGALNTTVEGRLLTVVPSAKACAEIACTPAQWSSAVFRNTLPGQINAYNWEQNYTSNPAELCLYNNTASCTQGDVPLYAINATAPEHLQAGIAFASQHDLRVAVKSSGHDYLGRSTARNSLLLWTQYFQNIEFNESFTVGGDDMGSAVTVGSGMVVGGSAATVSAGGGYTQGAGHSVFSPAYGLAADNTLQYKIVLANGSFVAANDVSNPDLFWALRGGGAGSWGVITSITMRTHPIFSATLHSANITFNSTSQAAAAMEIHARHLSDYDSFRAGQYFSLYNLGAAGGIQLQMRTYFPNVSNDSAQAAIAPFIADVEAIGASVVSQTAITALANDLVARADDDGGVNLVLASRLIPETQYEQNPSAIGAAYKALLDQGVLGILGNLVAGGQVAENANITSAIHPKWRTAKTHIMMVTTWDDTALPSDVVALQERFYSQNVPILAAATGEEDSGSYSNEASVLETDFKATFFGPNYDRLLSIKAQYDPKDLFVHDWRSEMHPFGGSPRCPRCEKAVYAAEQVMGPGRKLYHKSCLTCKECNKRLDSYSLVEHEEEPYCKNCHRKLFGNRDLRQQNLPYRPASPERVGANGSPFTGGFNGAPLSPTRTGGFGAAPSSPVRANYTGGGRVFGTVGTGRASPAAAALLRPTRALSPTRTTFTGGMDASSLGGSFDSVPEEGTPAADPDKSKEPTTAGDETEEAEVEKTLRLPLVAPGTPTHTGFGRNGMPRTGQLVPSSPTKVRAPDWDDDDSAGVSVSASTPVATAAAATPPPSTSAPALPPRAGAAATVGRRPLPLTQTPTGAGVRYPSPLNQTPTGNRFVGGSSPICPRCQKAVFFAEQVKAVGSTWHKACLRCMECNTTLDSKRLTEKEGTPFCHRCYNKLHGPAGNGYALLGKAGG
ncbi:unnamed protein product [Peniophora sp. CBMAI 1063]|nr:unnamed protein product [Peniophora sp. CBMAI 1063]